MHKKILFAVLISLNIIAVSFGQEQTNQDSIDVTVIDSYVSPEIPHHFLLSFFTSSKCKSKLLIDNKYEYTISDTLTEDHNIKVDITGLNFKTKSVPYIILVQDSSGHTFKSDKYEFELPGEIKIQSESNFLLLCLFGATVFALPSPVFVTTKDGNYFSLTKEIPILTFRSASYSYPAGYFSAEYSYIFNAQDKNFFRIGYKEIFVAPVFEYVSPGLDLFTNFQGYNGVSAEFSVGWFKLFNTFTVYTRYRFNLKPGEGGKNFNEISLGLYSSFFSIYF